MAGTFYSQIAANRRNSFFLMLILVAILSVLGFAIGYGTTGQAGAGLGWLGIFGMVTAAEHRGLGVGASVLAELLREGRRLGATGAYLQVEADNAPALALYAAAGFTPAYDYDYWAPAEASTRDAYC